MGDLIIKTGDSLTVTIPAASVPKLEAPVQLMGSGTDVLVDGMPVCLPSDVQLPAALTGPLPYTAPPFTIDGTGTLTLGAPNATALTLSDGNPIVIQGQFSATFTVDVEDPATMETPDGPVPDPVLVKAGSANFNTTNTTVTAS